MLMVVLIGGAERQGDPHLRIGLGKLEVRWGDTNYGVRLAIEHQGLTDNLGVRGKMAAPVLTTQHYSLALVRKKSTSEHRIDPQQVKKVHRNRRGPHLVGLAASGQGVKFPGLIGGHTLEGLRLLLPVGKVPYGNTALFTLRARFSDGNELARILVGSRMQEHCINDAKDGRGGPNPERERDRSYRREAGIFCQHAQAVTKVLNKVFDVVHSAHVSTLLFGLFDATQLPQGCVAGFLPSQPFCGLLLNQVFQVEAKFLGQLLLDAALAEERPEAKRKLVCPAHERFSVSNGSVFQFVSTSVHPPADLLTL